MQWHDVLADKSLHDLPYKIELNPQGHIEMSPSSFIHSFLQGELASLLKNRLGGRIFTELAIQTRNGVKVPDVAWGSDDYFQQHRHELCASAAPEICVEIISQSNSTKEMRNKIALYLRSGAIEVWLVDEQGKIRFFTAQGQQPASCFDIEIEPLL